MYAEYRWKIAKKRLLGSISRYKKFDHRVFASLRQMIKSARGCHFYAEYARMFHKTNDYILKARQLRQQVLLDKLESCGQYDPHIFQNTLDEIQSVDLASCTEHEFAKLAELVSEYEQYIAFVEQDDALGCSA